MNYSDFVTRVQGLGGPQKDASKIIAAIIQTLADRLDPEVCEHMASQLPHELKAVARSSGRVEKLTLEQFHERIALRADIPPERVPAYVKATLLTLRDALSPGEVDHVLASLPGEYLAEMHT